MDSPMGAAQYEDILDANRTIAIDMSRYVEKKTMGEPEPDENYGKHIIDFSLCYAFYRGIYDKFKRSNSDSSCNTITKKRRMETNLSSLEVISNHLIGTKLVNASSIEQHEVLLSAVELRVSFLKTVVGNLIKSGSSIKKIAGILFIAECRLSDVICLQNVDLTISFLKEQDSMSNKYSFKTIGDSRASVDRAMSFLDVDHTEIVLKYGSNKDIKIRRFFRNLVSMAMQHFNLEALKLFVEQIAKWNILDKETCMLLEQEVYFKADKEVIQIFLQSGLHNHIDKVFGINVLVALFGNPNIKIGFLKRRKFNVNARGTNGSTALHYATKNKLFKKVKYLLDREVDPNSMTWKYVTAFHLALCEPNVNVIENEKCAGLLLQYGADPLLLTSDWTVAECCINVQSFIPRHRKDMSIGYLSKLTLAYLCIHVAAGIRKIKLSRSSHRILLGPGTYSEEEDLRDSRSQFEQELQKLKEDKIRENITMFTILYETGRKLFQLLNEEDCKVISRFIEKYSEEKILNRYYLRALREHMRQVRKLAAHKNRAMFVIASSVPLLASYFTVLEKIISYFTYEDLLKFQ